MRRGGRLALLVCAPALAWPCASSALLAAHPYVAAQEMYDTNVFSASRELQALLRNGDTRRADTIFRALAGTDASYTLGLQKIYGEVEGRRIDYAQFDELDHDEYGYSGGLLWNAANRVDGRLAASQERRMASFINRDSDQLTLERERVGTAAINYNVTPLWRVETGFRHYDLASPLPAFPDFALRETSGSLGLKYTTESKLAVGAVGEYLEGRFRGIPDLPGFRRLAGDATLGFDVSDVSRLNAAAGYTTLRGGQINVEGITADIGYRRVISALTEVKFDAFRRIDGYLAGANAVTDIGATAGVTYQPTYKIRIDGDYSYIHSVYRRLSPYATIPSGRRDDFHVGSLSIAWQMLDWLGVRIFGKYSDHRSTERIESFNDAQVGGEIRLRWPDRSSDEGQAKEHPATM